MDSEMDHWWGQRTPAERDQWCEAAGGGTVTALMASTIPAGKWLTPEAEAWTMQPPFREFLVIMCG
ncbi:MAG TPA: hypothetical protein VGJ28_04710 [Micromonosporaceae bacterium]|jgi:hypothetical protein